MSCIVIFLNIDYFYANIFKADLVRKKTSILNKFSFLRYTSVVPTSVKSSLITNCLVPRKMYMYKISSLPPSLILKIVNIFFLTKRNKRIELCLWELMVYSGRFLYSMRTALVEIPQDIIRIEVVRILYKLT